MIVGVVSAYGEPLVELTVHGPTGVTARLTAMVDTGFTESLTLPAAVIAALGLINTSQGSAVLADGPVTTFDVFAGWVEWHSTRRKIGVQSAEIDPLLGMTLLADSELWIACRPGGAVEITPAAPPLAPAP